MLARASPDTNVKVVEVARWLVAQTERHVTSRP
ncbi:hypothetical protein H4W33_000589 [Kibdelosporangium phytohabitans]|nr:hypothetical protein [Kibdelosporangium phytohabitans]